MYHITNQHYSAPVIPLRTDDSLFHGNHRRTDAVVPKVIESVAFPHRQVAVLPDRIRAIGL